MTRPGSIVHCIQRRTVQLIPILMLVALLGQPVLRQVPSMPTAGSSRKLASTTSASGLADNRKISFWQQRHSQPKLDGYLRDHCATLKEAYDQLLDPAFSLWNQTGFPVDLLEHTSGDRVYVRKGQLRLSQSTTLIRLIPTFVNYIQHIAQLVRLPDMLLPLNPADEPLAEIRAGEGSRPLLAFCSVPGFSDVLMPNTLEGQPMPDACMLIRHTAASFTSTLVHHYAQALLLHCACCQDHTCLHAMCIPLPTCMYLFAGDVYNASYAKRGDRSPILSGPDDTRKPMVVWRGTTGGFGGLRKGRQALLQLGLDRPDLVDSGVSDWNEELYGPDEGRMKSVMDMREQIETYKYQAWLPGNCASVRLALQLASDAAVFKIENDESEWYYPLLEPYVHYIPITANETHTDLPKQLAWAESHRDSVRKIVQSANAFAATYLSGHGRDCYFMQLLSQYRQHTNGKLKLPKKAQKLPEYVPWV